ncbi:MAG: hypothetical protein ACRD35_00340 [Candidatus Acidiferrales bacterium]
MLRKTFAAVILALLLPALLSAYIIVLKNGRRLEARARYTVEAGKVKCTGTDGIAYEFPLSAVDFEATERANAPEGKRTPKVWTNDELEVLTRTGPVGISETESAPEAAAPATGEGSAAPAAEGAAEPAAEEETKPLPPKEQDPEYWRKRLQPLRDELGKVEQQLQQLRSGQNQAASNAVSLQSDAPGVEVADTIRRLERKREDLLRQIDDVQAEARRAGVPPAWVR